MILNLMLGSKAGGLEQAALDYAEALRLAGIDSISITPPSAWVNASFDAANIGHQPLNQLGAWDPIAAYRLRQIAKKSGATAVICHGNRALRIAARALSGTIPIVAVAHNYQTKHFDLADACFCITEHARTHLMETGFPADKLFFMPNMVRTQTTPATTADHSPRVSEPAPPRAYRSPPVIGTMARMVPKKGLEVYIDALAIVKSRGLKFRAVIGGTGDLDTILRAQAASLGLKNDIEFIGWVGDKDKFYSDIDIFVLPSHHEAFGIVVIEAMAAGVPMVSTDSIGPREIIRPNRDGLLVPCGDATAMADAISALLRNPALAQQFAASAQQRVENEYTMRAMAERLKAALPNLSIRR